VNLYVILSPQNPFTKYAAISFTQETANIAFKLSDDTPTSPVLSSTPVFSSFSLGYPAPVHIPNQPPTPPPPVLLRDFSTALAHALIHTFTTQLPSVWNAAILNISANPRLERIILSDGSYESSFPEDPFYPCHLPSTKAFLPPWRTIPFSAQNSNAGVVGTGLFLMEARKHPRLSELIRAGMLVTRGRAHVWDGESEFRLGQ
jgi:hypothetical protein